MSSTPSFHGRHGAAAALFAAPVAAFAQSDTALDRVTITATRPASMPVEIPTTLESITAAEIDRRVNATDAEDALKYFPSLSVRKRYIGDYDHAVLATRASGTGNSARSLVYADGILLSNLLGNGAGFTPRWGLVTPEEIERVDVLYGPFSAAYSGNSAGAIVDFVTRMPRRFEAHVKLQGATQPYRLYGTDDRYSGAQGSASIGSRSGDWSWWVNLSRLVGNAQPIGFVVKPVPAAAGAGGTPVRGAFLERNPKDIPVEVLGTTGQTHTAQDHAKLKLAWDVTPAWRASYTLGGWRNVADRDTRSFLRDAQGRVVSGDAAAATVSIDGRTVDIAPTDFAASRASLTHVAQGLSLKSHGGERWDAEVAASAYDYHHDAVRSQVPNVAAPNAGPDAGRIADQHGTGWTTLAAKGVWRPDGRDGEHVAEFGLQRDAFKLRTTVSDTPEWTGGDAARRFSGFAGNTTLTSLWAQDAWRFAPGWRAVLGGRLERWRAFDGALSDATTTRRFAPRGETDLSPKAAVSWQAAEAWTLKASLGRAVRMPTVSELFQGTIVAGEVVDNDPNLRPEKSWTTELSAEHDDGAGLWRGTLFAERTGGALYSQVNASGGGTVATIQNVDRVRTLGVETAWQATDVGRKGLDLNASLTCADSRITRDDALPASLGRWQPRVPQWRATALASQAAGERWSTSLGLRYSGRQYGQLDNSDVHGHAYTGFSAYVVADLRIQYRIAPAWLASAGVDNLGNERYWAFHPYPQRTFHAELRFDL